MVDKIEEAVRRYYGVVAAVIGIIFTVVAAVYAVTKPMQDDISELKADARELRAIAAGNAARQEETRIRTEREFECMWEIVRRVEARQNADGRR